MSLIKRSNEFNLISYRVDYDKSININIEKAKRGNHREREKIVLKYLPLIKKKAKGRHGIIDEDLMQSLIEDIFDKIIYRFDTNKNARFITYLYTALDNSVRKYKGEKYNKNKEFNDSTASLDDEKKGLMDILQSNKNVEEKFLGNNTIELIEEKLDKRKRNMLFEYYIKGMTYEELGERYDVTLQGARYIISKSIKDIRKAYNKI